MEDDIFERKKMPASAQRREQKIGMEEKWENRYTRGEK